MHLQDARSGVVDDRIVFLRPPAKPRELKSVGDVSIRPAKAAMRDQDADLVILLIDKCLAFAGALALFESGQE
jgi:hypothetical protein